MNELDHIDIPDHYLPDGVSGASWCPPITRLVAESHCRHAFDHTMETKAWVILWLMDRVEELEQQLGRNGARKIEAYDAARVVVKREGLTRAEYVLRAETAEARVNDLELALAFYANPASYREVGTGSPNSFGNYESTECPVWDDAGELARDVLGGPPR